jgi:thioredoxin-related protein
MRNVIALSVALVLAAPQARAWMTDLKTAQDRAYAENRVVLLDFTGSDWCGWCKKLKAEVFDTAEFNAFADRHLVLVEVDFPRNKPVTPQQRAANHGLANKYGVDGYPTIILLSSKGELIGRLGYMAGGPKPFIQAIREQTGLPASGGSKGPSEPDGAPIFGGAKIGPPPKYNELTLKSISGNGSKKLALINNQTLAPGESAKVRLGAGEVKLRLEEIRDKSVVVTIEGKGGGRKELPLKKT